MISKQILYITKLRKLLSNDGWVLMRIEVTELTNSAQAAVGIFGTLNVYFTRNSGENILLTS